MALSKDRIARLAERFSEFENVAAYTEMMIRESDNAGSPLFRQCACNDEIPGFSEKKILEVWNSSVRASGTLDEVIVGFVRTLLSTPRPAGRPAPTVVTASQSLKDRLFALDLVSTREAVRYITQLENELTKRCAK